MGNIGPDRRKKLKKLAILMNRMQEMPIPPAKGIIDLMDMSIKPEEVDYLLKMGTWQFTFDQAAALSGMPKKSFKAFFANLKKNGLVVPAFGENREGADMFELMPLVPGWIEFQLLRGADEPYEKEFAGKMEDLLNSLKKLNVFPLRPLSNLLIKGATKPFITMGSIRESQTPDPKFIQVNRKVTDTASTVLPLGDAYQLIDEAPNNPICLLPCFCRKWRRYMDDPCRLDIPDESCLIVGAFGKHAIDLGMGRSITKKDALGVMEDVAKAGAVHSLFHEKDNTTLPQAAICNCCWDCCGVLGGFNRGAVSLYYKCYYQALMKDKNKCTGCAKCMVHCPTKAIDLVDKKAEIKSASCIGCGQCALQCPANVMEMMPLRRDVMVPLQKKSEIRIS